MEELLLKLHLLGWREINKTASRTSNRVFASDKYNGWMLFNKVENYIGMLSDPASHELKTNMSYRDLIIFLDEASPLLSLSSMEQ